jgi:hypothetical protein
MRPFVRPRLTTGVTIASAGILALSLVTAPPHVNVARTEVRAVQIAAFALPPAALLEKFMGNQAQTVLPVIPVVGGGAADIITADITNKLPFVQPVKPSASPTQATGVTAQSEIDSANDSQQGNTALAAALVPDGVITDPILRSIIAVFFFFVVIPVFGVLLFFFPPTFPAAAALSALPEPPSPAEPEIDTHPATSKPQMAEVDPVMSKPQVAEVDPVMSKPQMAEVDPMVSKPQETDADPVMSKPQETDADQLASKPQVAEVDPVASKPQETDADPVASSRPAKRADKPETHGPGDQSTTRTVAGGGGPSTPGTSSKDGASGGSTPGGDTDGS